MELGTLVAESYNQDCVVVDNGEEEKREDR